MRFSVNSGITQVSTGGSVITVDPTGTTSWYSNKVIGYWSILKSGTTELDRIFHPLGSSHFSYIGSDSSGGGIVGIKEALYLMAVGYGEWSHLRTATTNQGVAVNVINTLNNPGRISFGYYWYTDTVSQQFPANHTIELRVATI